MEPLHISPALALRLEGIEAANSRSVIERIRELRPGDGAVSVPVCGGWASYAGPGSFLSQMLHLGLSGTVSGEEWNRMERFFREHDTAAVISLCPFADPSVFEWLVKRNYRISHFENTLVRPLGPVEGDPEPAASAPSDLAKWARRLVQGFSAEGDSEPSESLTHLVMALGSAKISIPLEAVAEGETAACAILGIADRTAILHCDSTIERFRGRGLQTSLIHERLRRAAAAGCDLAMACTVPGTVSQRNYERAGFRVAYTKTMLVKDWN